MLFDPGGEINSLGALCRLRVETALTLLYGGQRHGKKYHGCRR